MPIVIVYHSYDIIPAILKEDTDDLMVARLRSLKNTPTFDNATSAREWLASLPDPSGWFETTGEAFAHTERLKHDFSAITGDDVRRVREDIGLSRAAFATEIGLGGNDNTRHKTIFEIENGKTKISKAAARGFRNLCAREGLKAVS